MLRQFLGVVMLSLLVFPTEFFPKQRSWNKAISNQTRNETSSLQSQEVNFRRLKIEELQRQIDGNIEEKDAIPAQERVFTDLNSWRAFWSQYSKGNIPEVDFKTSSVAAVFLGPKPNPGYGVKINRISYNSRTRLTVIHVIELLPNPKMGYAAVVVHPAEIVVFPALPGKLQFVRTRKISEARP